MNYTRDCRELLGGVLHASSVQVSIMIPGIRTSVYRPFLSFHSKPVVVLGCRCSIVHLSSRVCIFRFTSRILFFPSSDCWGSTWPSVILIYSAVHNQGTGFFLGVVSTSSVFFFLFNVLPLHPCRVEYQSWALSALCLAFRPHCAPCNMTSGQQQQQSLLYFPVYRRPCDLHLPLLCQTVSHSHGRLICAQHYYCRTEATRRSFTVGKEPAVFLLVPDWEFDWKQARRRQCGKLWWSCVEVADNRSTLLLLWCNRNDFHGSTHREAKKLTENVDATADSKNDIYWSCTCTHSARAGQYIDIIML